MGSLVKKIEDLNKRIDVLMKEKTRSDGKRETYQSNLSDKCKAYEKKYGVKLIGSTMQETVKRISAEFSKVQKNLAEEYEFSEKVVSLIEQGDIAEAKKLLGITDEEVSSSEEDFGWKDESLEGNKDFMELTSKDEIVEKDDESDSTSDPLDDLDFLLNRSGEEFDEMFGDATEKTSAKSKTKPKTQSTEKGVQGTFAEMGILDQPKEKKDSNGSSNKKQTVPKMPTLSVDDDEDDDDLFGFGELLKGGKFDV